MKYSTLCNLAAMVICAAVNVMQAGAQTVISQPVQQSASAIPIATIGSIIVMAVAEVSGAGYRTETSFDGSGTLPPSILLPSGAVSVQFAITGGSRLNMPGYGGPCAAPCITTNYGSRNTYNDADGVGDNWPFNMNADQSISGSIASTAGFVAGVFENGEYPQGTPPPTLDFTVIGTSFTSLSPELNQVFFVGDGLTGDGAGARQTFVVPTGAKVLYLGIADSQDYLGPAGSYADNYGEFIVSYFISTTR